MAGVTGRHSEALQSRQIAPIRGGRVRISLPPSFLSPQSCSIPWDSIHIVSHSRSAAHSLRGAIAGIPSSGSPRRNRPQSSERTVRRANFLAWSAVSSVSTPAAASTSPPLNIGVSSRTLPGRSGRPARLSRSRSLDRRPDLRVLGHFLQGHRPWGRLRPDPNPEAPCRPLARGSGPSRTAPRSRVRPRTSFSADERPRQAPPALVSGDRPREGHQDHDRCRHRGPQACPKGLRHAFGIAAVAACMPLPTITAAFRHANTQTTAIYTTAAGLEVRDFLARMWKREGNADRSGI